MYRYIHPVYFVYKIKLFASITWGVFERNSHSLALNSITGKKKHTEAKPLDPNLKQLYNDIREIKRFFLFFIMMIYYYAYI